jgi:hypothetical protein
MKAEPVRAAHLHVALAPGGEHLGHAFGERDQVHALARFVCPPSIRPSGRERATPGARGSLPRAGLPGGPLRYVVTARATGSSGAADGRRAPRASSR